VQALADPQVDLVALEKDKIKGAVRTDFILSAEIIAITLGTVAARRSAPRCGAGGIALVMTSASTAWWRASSSSTTLGLWLSRRPGAARRRWAAAS
jgi:predicted DNA repair protein MutK